MSMHLGVTQNFRHLIDRTQRMLLQTPLPPCRKRTQKNGEVKTPSEPKRGPPVYEEVSIAHKYSRLWAVYFKMENNTITFIPNEQSVS